MSVDVSGCNSPWFVDTTLRDGAQMPGVVFQPSQRIELALALDALGIHELELAVAAREGQDWSEPQRLLDAGVDARLTSWCRLSEEDVKLALSTAVDCVHVGIPCSQLQLSNVGLSKSQVLQRLERCLTLVRAAGRYASVGAVDASRSSAAWLTELAQRCSELGAQRFRLADTVGCWSPLAVGSLFTSLRCAVPSLVLGIHAHNDLGLATANTLAALDGGAESLDVTVLGIGERAGNAALEQVAMALKMTSHRTPQLQLAQLAPICQRVAEMIGLPIPFGAPVVGANAFRHSSGIHVDGMLKNSASFEAFSPELCGGRRELCLGEQSGRAAERAKLARFSLRPVPVADQLQHPSRRAG